MGHSPNQSAQSVTVSPTGGIGGVALFTVTGQHTYYHNQPIVLSGGGAPTGFTLGTTYYVAQDKNFSSSTFALAAVPSGPAIVASSAGTTVTSAPPTGTYRILRVHKLIEEQWLTGQGSAAAAKAAAKNPATFNQNQFWKRRKVMQFLGSASGSTPYEDEFEYVVSGADDGT